MAEEKRPEGTEDNTLYDRLYAEVSGEAKGTSEPEAPGTKGTSDTEKSAAGSKAEQPKAERAEKTPETEYKAESGNAGPESVEHRSDRGRKEYTARFFDFFSRESKYIREQAVLSRIDDAHLMDYLALEQKRYESEQKLRDERGKRILSAFQLAVSLAAIVAVIGFLKDEPTVLVNILYIIGIIAALWLWKMKK